MTPSWKPISLGAAPHESPGSPVAAQRQANARTPLNQKILVTKAEAAELLGISESVIGKLIARGELPVVRAETRLVRIRVVDLHRWAAEHLCCRSDEQNLLEPTISLLQ